MDGSSGKSEFEKWALYLVRIPSALRREKERVTGIPLLCSDKISMPLAIPEIDLAQVLGFPVEFVGLGLRPDAGKLGESGHAVVVGPHSVVRRAPKRDESRLRP